MSILERFATRLVKPIICKEGHVIFLSEELTHVSLNGHKELTEATEIFCDGHCNNGRCWEETLHDKLEPLRRKKII